MIATLNPPPCRGARPRPRRSATHLSSPQLPCNLIFLLLETRSATEPYATYKKHYGYPIWLHQVPTYTPNQRGPCHGEVLDTLTLLTMGEMGISTCNHCSHLISTSSLWENHAGYPDTCHSHKQLLPSSFHV